VTGNDLTVTLGGQYGIFELNVMLPLIAYNLLQSIALLAASVDVFAEKCIEGITANHDKCAANIEKSLAMVTGLVPHIGYDRAAALAKMAYDTGKTIREVVLEENVLPEDLVDKILNPAVR
jgi:fumarate hydratase class II